MLSYFWLPLIWENSTDSALSPVFHLDCDHDSKVLLWTICDLPWLCILSAKWWIDFISLSYCFSGIRNILLPYSILELFSPSPSNYNLRNSDFHVQRVKTVKYGKHSLRFFGPFLWSKLSMKDRNETSLRRFKENIRKKDLSELVSENAYKRCHLCNS